MLANPLSWHSHGWGQRMQFDQLKRREFITVLGGAVAWPLAARAQQAPIPVVGFLSTLSPSVANVQLDGFIQGLNEAGYVENRNIAIEFRWAEGHYDRLPGFTADLVERRVAVIMAGGPPAARCKSGNGDDPYCFHQWR
jgi:putative ABC transport system substrate-binding protein